MNNSIMTVTPPKVYLREHNRFYLRQGPKAAFRRNKVQIILSALVLALSIIPLMGPLAHAVPSTVMTNYSGLVLGARLISGIVLGCSLSLVAVSPLRQMWVDEGTFGYGIAPLEPFYTRIDRESVLKVVRNAKKIVFEDVTGNPVGSFPNLGWSTEQLRLLTAGGGKPIRSRGIWVD